MCIKLYRERERQRTGIGRGVYAFNVPDVPVTIFRCNISSLTQGYWVDGNVPDVPMNRSNVPGMALAFSTRQLAMTCLAARRSPQPPYCYHGPTTSIALTHGQCTPTANRQIAHERRLSARRPYALRPQTGPLRQTLHAWPSQPRPRQNHLSRRPYQVPALGYACSCAGNQVRHKLCPIPKHPYSATMASQHGLAICSMLPASQSQAALAPAMIASQVAPTTAAPAPG